MLLHTEKYDFTPPWSEEQTPLVLIHGLGANTKMWFPQIPDFSKHFPLILVDLPGYGESPDPGTKFTIEDMATYVNKTLDNLGIKKASIMGISLGGVVATEYASRYSEKVDKLILVSTPHGATDEIRPALLQAIELFKTLDVKTIITNGIHKAFSENAPDEMRQYIIDLTCQVDHSAYIRSAEAPIHYDLSSKFEKIKCNTLIINSEFDLIAPITDGKKIHSKIENSELYILEDVGHTSTIESPEKINHKVISFLKESA